jgi:hypothetical protein
LVGGGMAPRGALEHCYQEEKMEKCTDNDRHPLCSLGISEGKNFDNDSSRKREASCIDQTTFVRFILQNKISNHPGFSGIFIAKSGKAPDTQE